MGTVWRHIIWLAGGLALGQFGDILSGQLVDLHGDSLETYYLVSRWVSMGTDWRHIIWSDGGLVWGQFGDILSA